MLVWDLEGCGDAVDVAGSVAASEISCSVTVAVFKELENHGGWKAGLAACAAEMPIMMCSHIFML